VAETEAQSSYRPPSVTYHGRVGELTLSHSLLIGARAARFAASFASSLHSTHTAGDGRSAVLGATQGNAPRTPSALPTGASGHRSPGGQDVLAGDPSNSLGAGGGGGAGGSSRGGAGGKLPFTGLAVLAVSGAGAALVSAGTAIRRLTRRGARSSS
jgi:hypothetical protein